MTGSTGTELATSLRGQITKLYRWIESNGWRGWDPYDIWDTPVGRWSTRSKALPRRAVRLSLSRAQVRWPLGLRMALGAQPAVNAKAVGLLAGAFLRMSRSVDPATHADARRSFDWLIENGVTTYGGMGWGYPFDWQSKLLIPRGTPTVVNSAVIGDAFWTRYKYGDAEALPVCVRICEFILEGLNRTPGRDNTFCFSYTPLDHFQVHNANLFGAEFVARIARETDNMQWMDHAVNAGRFSLLDILADGSLPYWASTYGGQLAQDTYHSGFEIRSLQGLAVATRDVAFADAAVRYFQTWCSDFFTPSGVPHHARGNARVVEVHSCAEALLCLSMMHTAGHLDSGSFITRSHAVLHAANDALWQPCDDGGYYAWMARHSKGRWIATDIPLIRWGQSWMLSAMVATLQSLQTLLPSTSDAIDEATFPEL